VAAILLGSGILAVCAILRRASIPILGDGYTVINNFRNTVTGVHPLSTSHEPLGMAYFYFIGQILRVTGGWSSTDAILAGDILLIVVFIACAFRTVRELFPGEGDARRTLTLLFILSVPYLQLFFGYVEVYAVVLAAMSVTTLGVVLHHRGKIPFYLLPPLFALQISVHYLGMLLLPLLLVLGVREWKAAGARSIVPGILLALLVLLPLPLWLGWSRLLPAAPHSPVLPLFTITDSYTAYTLLSGVHLLEIANLIVFMGAGSFLALILARGMPGPPDDRGLSGSLVLAVSPLLVFALVAKFDLGMAKDWDVTAPYFYPLALLGAYRLLSGGNSAIRAMSVVVAAVFLSTSAFINLNADREPSLRRVKTLMDPSIMPQGGIYQTSIHLSTAYLETRQIDSMVVLWRHYISRYPDDQRGYQKLAKSLWEKGEPAYGTIIEVMGRWESVAAGDPTVKRQYAQFCVMAGTASMNAGRFDEARSRFATAAGVDPRDTLALEGLAGACRMLGDSTGYGEALRRAAGAGSVRAAQRLSGGTPSR
jgi:hypothetical protein